MNQTQNKTQGKALRDAVRQLMLAHGILQTNTRPCGTPLTIPHAQALLALHEHDTLSVGQLAEHLSIDRTNVSRLTKKMADLGEVERQVDPNDRRAMTLQLTAKGRDVAQHVDQASQQHFNAVLEHIESAQHDAIIETLNTLTTAIQHTGASS